MAAAIIPAPAVVNYSAGGAVITAQFDLPQVRTTAEGLVELSLTNTFPGEQAGQPVLPEGVVVVALPDGAQVQSCRVTPSDTVVMPLPARVRHGRAAAAYSDGPGEPSVPDPETYALDVPYPMIDLASWSIERRGSQRLVNVRLTPVQYVPASGILLANRRLDVAVTWTFPAAAGKEGGKAAARPLAPVVALTSGTLPAAGRFDYVVITSADLLETPAPNNFQALCAARNRGGLIATNVTTDWICANYPGTRPDGGTDDPTRIRNFIADAYQNWGTRYVLLGGTAARVPTRLLYGYVQAADSIASDMYYGCLDGTFDFNANGVYGEAGDGEEGQDVDLVAEVYVGRFPVATTNEVANMVRKTLAYEQAAPAQLRKTSHAGEWLGFGGVSDYATATMEQLRTGGSFDGYATVGFGNAPNAASFDTSDCLYDAPGYTWANTEIIRRFQQDFHVFNHLGHGNINYCFRLYTGYATDRNAILGLTNASYFLGYSQACESGHFDGATECLAETLVTATNGPAALVMNTRNGWGAGGTTDGPSQRYHRRFWDQLLSGSSTLLGEANQRSKEDVRYAVNDYSGAMRWCYYELTLFGDPALPFGARISPLPPVITFTPLQNQLESESAYRVTCTFGPAGLYDPDSPQLVWRTSLAPEIVHTSRFTQVAGTLHEAFIPSAPEGASVSYFIRVASRAGLVARSPAAGEYDFCVTRVFTLTVSGDPQPSGTVTPGYGVTQVASGNTVCASADLREVLEGGHARRCRGWQGSGSVPASGSSNELAFVMDQPSTLAWRWADEYLFYQQASVPGLLETNAWYDVGTTAATVTAADRIAGHCFAGWYLDDARVPLSGRATNRVAGVCMDQPHEATALYLPEALDADGDQVPDWYEMYYYGTTDPGPADDTDGDGAGMLLEYLARTDPGDAASCPRAPVITVMPLDLVLSAPPPYRVYVMIEDTSPLAGTQVVWRINDGVLQSRVLASVPGGTNLYTGTLTGAAASGDTITYWVWAAGQDGLSAQSAIFTTRLQYAAIVLGAPLARAYVAIQPGPAADSLSVSNSGTATLTWRASAGLGEYADAPPTLDWNLGAIGTPWTWSTARSRSAPASLRAVIVSPSYPNGRGQHAAMTSPPIRIGTHALLAFSYWISSELDTTQAAHCWDGGLVELSTNGGAAFMQLPGPYTHAITGWYASPWPDGTPCFAGSGDGWHDVSFDLSAFAGATVILRFHYGADDNTDREGWYVDNIRVAPLDPDVVPGVALAPGSGSVSPGGVMPLEVAVDAAQFSQRWLRLPVLLRCNDPISPVAWYDLAFDIRHSPVLSLVAAQATNGSGLVSVSGAFVDPDGESRTLTFSCSGDDGATWSVPRLSCASFSHGVATLNTNAGTIAHAVPSGLRPQATNSFALQWDTRHPSNTIQLAMRTLLRVRATDPSYADASVLAPPFPVDNQPPDISALHFHTRQPQTWSDSRHLTFSWHASDGAGIGLLDTRVTLARPGEGTNSTTRVYPEPPASLSLDCDADSTNWWLTVQARDRMGNEATNRAGPFWVDATPPVAGTLGVATNYSRFGNYIVAASVPLAGSNFTDALSGIASYSFDNATRPDVHARSAASNRLEWVAAAGEVDHPFLHWLLHREFCSCAIAWGVTNTFRVVATDLAGNTSAPVTVRVLVLNPTDDADGDGILNADEELTGTSLFAASQPFTVMRDEAPPASGLTLRWPAITGNHYTVECSTQLAAGVWMPVPGLADLDGTDGVMTAVVPFDAGTSFFRVRITP
ncbi:MAG: C25 family cysteine peptidase [bacterium]